MAPDNNDYTVGWISALYDERASAEALLDEEYDDLPLKEGDDNSYTLGKIGQHNVVIAGMPVGTYGTTLAAIVAANLLRSFPNIRFGLLVGVGGGVPGAKDLRLGDVVISIPEGINGGVIQYDFGTAIQEKKFIRKGSLNKPPMIIANALGKLRSKAERKGYSCWQHYDNMLERNPKMKPRFSRPSKDDLYEADYVHEGNESDCLKCSPERLVSRTERPEQEEPLVFYGTVGSANKVLRDAQVRDELNEQAGIICFETEAAGLMDNFPCIVIRGICDYADTHKNKEWQPYASAVAAAFAKELVLSIAPSLVVNLPQANQILKEGKISERQDQQVAHLHSIETKIDLTKLSCANGAAYNSFSGVDEADSRCLPGTRLDLLTQIREWATTSSKCIFWLNGMAGTGKSTIARTLAAEFDEQEQLGASFFFKSGQGDRGTASAFVVTIANQLAHSIPEIRPLISKALKGNPSITDQALRPQFERLILHPLQEITNPDRSVCVIVIDALDECENEDHIKSIVKLLSQLESVKMMRMRIIITSRPELPTKLGFRMVSKDTYQDLILHRIEKSVVGHDIALFFRHKFEQIRFEWSEPSHFALPADWPGENNIEVLTEMAIPLFIFAATVCRFIGDRFSNPQESLNLVLEYRNETGLDQMDQTYKPILDRILNISGKRNELQELTIKRFRNVVGSIIVLADYLSIDSLANLLQMDRLDIYNLLRHLHSVLDNVDDLNRPIRPLHLSFANYLLEPKRCPTNQFQIDEMATHTYLAYKCIDLLQSSKLLKQDICDLKRPGFLRSEIEQSTLSRCIPSELQYACCYWVLHLEKSRCKISDRDKFHLFLDERFLWWLEALSLIGRISTAIGMVSTLQTLVNEKDSSELVDFLLDAQRFILTNCFIADIAPLQLNYSSVVFAPQRCFVRSKCNLPKWLIRSPPMEETWTGRLQTLEGHSGEVNSVAFSPDGKQLVTSSMDKTVKIWGAGTGFLLHTLQAHSAVVNSAIFSPDGSQLASCSHDKTVRMWHVGTRSLQQTIEFPNWVGSVAFSPCGKELACACYDQKVRIVDTNTGSVQQILEGQKGYCISSVTFSPDGKQLAYSSYDGTVRIFDAGTGSVKQILEQKTGHFAEQAVFSPDGRQLASGSSDGRVRIWDTGTGFLQQTLKGHSDGIQSVAFSPDGKQVGSASLDRRVKIWNVDTGMLQKTEEHSKGVRSVAFSPDGKRLASASIDGTVRTWDLESLQQIFEGHSNSVATLNFSPDGEQLVSYSYDRTVKIWDTSTGSLKHTLEGDSNAVRSVTFSSGKKQLACCCGMDQTIKIWDVGTRILKRTLKGHSCHINSIVLSPEGKQLVSCSNNHAIAIWDVDTGDLHRMLEGHIGAVNSAAFSLNGKQLASCSDDCTVKMWDVGNGDLQQTFEGHAGGVKSIAFPPDGKNQLYSASDDKVIKIWDTGTGSLLRTIETQSWITKMSFHPTLAILNTNAGQIEVDYRDLDQIPSKISATGWVWKSENWIGIGDEKIIWLPPEYRHITSVFMGQTFVLGLVSGRVIFFEFSFEEAKIAGIPYKRTYT